MPPVINVHPTSSLFTAVVSIHGYGFQANAPITIRCILNSQSDEISFMSFAHVTTTKAGDFDLTTSKSLGGTYMGVDGMGLFWSMQPLQESRDRIQITNGDSSFTYNFDVYDGFVERFTEVGLAATNIQRMVLKEGVKRTRVSVGGIHGVLFQPKCERKLPAVITLYGATKKRQVIEDVAILLANSGFVSLALAFFNVADLPKAYDHIRIEYFEEAVEFLRSLPFVREDAVGVYGISKGGGIALTMLSYLPQVKAVACVNPCFSSIGGVTTYKDKRLELHPIDASKVSLTQHNRLSLTDAYSSIPSDSLIPFHEAKGPILVVLGMDDKCSDPEKCAHYIRGIKCCLKSDVEVATYEGLGHLVDAPFMPVCTAAYGVSAPPGTPKIEYGGSNTKLHANQQVKVWERVVQFFREALNPLKSSL